MANRQGPLTREQSVRFFETLKAVQWAINEADYIKQCPVCGGRRPTAETRAMEKAGDGRIGHAEDCAMKEAVLIAKQHLMEVDKDEARGMLGRFFRAITFGLFPD
jgi:hypothetical protein